MCQVHGLRERRVTFRLGENKIENDLVSIRKNTEGF